MAKKKNFKGAVMKKNEAKGKKRTEEFSNAIVKKPEAKEKSPYMSKGIYNNYSKGMKKTNKKRTDLGLEALHVRTFEEWSA